MTAKPTPAEAPEGPSEADKLIEQAAAAVPAPTGLKAAVAFLQANFDEEAHILWSTNGPRKSKTTQLAGILCEIDGIRRVVVVNEFESGAYRLFAEIAGKTREDVAYNLGNTYTAERVTVVTR